MGVTIVLGPVVILLSTSNAPLRTRDCMGWLRLKIQNEFEEPDLLSDESTSSIIRVIKEIKVGEDVIAAEIEHVSHEHNLIFSDEVKDNKYCNGCVLPILSSFYYCSQCDFFLHKACAELRRMRRLWFDTTVFSLVTDDFFGYKFCRHMCSGFSYKIDEDNDCDYTNMCLRCASIPHNFTYHADESHFLFFVGKYRGNCNACGKDLPRERTFICKDCMFGLDWNCVGLPRTAWHKCDQHSLTLAYQDCDDYPLRQYCDICEGRRDPQRWFYSCETCDKVMHIICVLGRFPFIKPGTIYTIEDHPHPLVFVKKNYYYPECFLCDRLGLGRFWIWIWAKDVGLAWLVSRLRKWALNSLHPRLTAAHYKPHKAANSLACLGTARVHKPSKTTAELGLDSDGDREHPQRLNGGGSTKQVTKRSQHTNTHPKTTMVSKVKTDDGGAREKRRWPRRFRGETHKRRLRPEGEGRSLIARRRRIQRQRRCRPRTTGARWSEQGRGKGCGFHERENGDEGERTAEGSAKLGIQSQ
ncbi:hypothetical protein GQ457_06G024410 [Hibiscus cannabinus]